MKIAFLTLIAFLICGCSFIISEDKNLKTYGINKEDASSWTGKIEKQRPENLKDIYIMQKKEPAQK